MGQQDSRDGPSTRHRCRTRRIEAASATCISGHAVNPPTLNVEVAAPILIHGDAAFAAQGIVAEVLNLQGVAGYATGGTIHIISNNQVGFTTDPSEGRSTRYASARRPTGGSRSGWIAWRCSSRGSRRPRCASAGVR